MNRELVTKWLIVVILGVLIPLPYFNHIAGGFAPLAHLWMIALGDYSYTALIPLNYFYCAIYSFGVYWVARGVARQITAGPAPQTVLVLVTVPAGLVTLLPIYGISDEYWTSRNLYEFVAHEFREFKMLQRSRARDLPKRLTRNELLKMQDTLVYPDIAVNVLPQTAPVGYAWWLRTRFIPTQDSIRGISASQLNPDWVRVSELRLDAIPADVRKSENPLLQWTPSFNIAGDFNRDGKPDIAVAGVYEDRSGHLGTFLAILTAEPKEKYQLVDSFAVSDKPEPVGLSVRKGSDGRLFVSYCTNCDSFAELVWNEKEKRFEPKAEEPYLPAPEATSKPAPAQEDKSQPIGFLPLATEGPGPHSKLCSGIRKGLIDRDVAVLAQLASHSLFWAGYEGEPPLATSFDAGVASFFERAFKIDAPVVGANLECRDKSYCLLPVEFKKEAHPYWYFVLEQRDGEWEWTGILISGRKAR